MTSLTDLLQQGSTNLWLFIPSTVLLGALHGLEPGHSKTMMAAFIVAIRGTVGQAALLGVSAAASHTAVVWIVALVGLHYGAQLDNDRTEAYFQLASAVLIIGIALWMIARTRREQLAAEAHRDHGPRHDHHHHHGHDHPHPHHDDHHGRHHEAHDHGHHPPNPLPALAAALNDDDYQDAHEREHAEAILQRFGDRKPGAGQIVLFGLTGGLVPCPASITVLLLCLQLKEYSLGLTLVLGFSIGLALTMVATGAIAALSVRAASKRFTGFGVWARRAPYLSSALIIGIGIYTASLGWAAL